MEYLGSLREHDAFAGNSARDERDILRQAAALDFFYGVHRGNAEDGGAAFAGLFNDAQDLFAGDERPNRVVNGDEFDVVANVIESSGDRFLASGATFNDANGLAEFL